REGLSAGLAELPERTSVPDRTALASVKAPALVIGCRGDVAHPPAIAEQLADVLPNASLHIYDQPAVLWTNRTDLRNRISEFLNAESA
ncbi:MAG TPA: alpha/beta hydrolase, partial [Micromonosporaceae bacterium]